MTKSLVLAMTFLRAVLGCITDYLRLTSTVSRKRAYTRPCPRAKCNTYLADWISSGVTSELDVEIRVPVRLTC